MARRPPRCTIRADNVIVALTASWSKRNGNRVVDWVKHSEDLRGFENLGGLKPQSKELIQHHTLYPFSTAFLPQVRSRQVLEAMRSKDGNSIHDRVGMRSSLVTVLRYFRFCPQCIQNDQKTYGELYWHRGHNNVNRILSPTPCSC